MFVQTIQGRVSDPGLFLKQMDRWAAELKPGATGFVGSTGGISDDGVAFIAARFESEEAAQANGNRPEQDAWWKETATAFDGEPAFAETTDVRELMGGGSDDAGFVQVIGSTITDRGRYETLSDRLESALAGVRPEVIGGIQLWFADGRTTEVIYFTSEAEARQGESRDLPEDLAGEFAEWQSLETDTTYLDLRSPHMLSP